MPYRLDPRDKHCVQVQGPDGWRRVTCHPTLTKARAHLTALRINVSEATFRVAPIYREGEFDSTTPPRSRRGLGRSANARLMDANLRHRHALLMAENGIAKDVADAYREAIRTIDAHLAQVAEGADALTDLGKISRDRLIELRRRMEEAVQIADAAAQSAVANGLGSIVGAETTFQPRLITRLLPPGISLDLTGPDEILLQRILTEPMGGKHYAARFQANYGETVGAMRASLAESVALGEGMDVAAERLQANVQRLSMNRAVTIARSEVQRVANRAAQETYAANAGPGGVVKGLQIVETLDGRTCLLCIQQDGKFFPAGEATGSLPPYHASCRGFITPVLKSWQDLGLNRAELSPATRASMNGQVTQPVTYPEWFGGQDAAFQREVLGATRYKLWQSGDLTLDGMVKNGRILPVSMLPSLT